MDEDTPRSRVMRLTSKNSRRCAPEVLPGNDYISRPEALRSLGAVLYAARLPSGEVKIGYTSNLQSRLYDFAGAKLLAIKPGTRQDETDTHKGLRSSLSYGREYYHDTPEVLAVVNEWRTSLGLPSLSQSSAASPISAAGSVLGLSPG